MMLFLPRDLFGQVYRYNAKYNIKRDIYIHIETL